MLDSASLRESAASLYRRWAAPGGQWQVRRLIRQGLPQPLHRPLQSLFADVLSAEERRVVANIEGMREALRRTSGSKEVHLGSQGTAVVLHEHLASRSSVSRQWGTFLYLCAVSSRARTILELGASTGLSGCYLASSSFCERFTTIEASPGLAVVARQHLGRVTGCARVVEGMIDDVLNDALATMPDGPDLVYFDAHKKQAPLLACFDRLVGETTDGSLLIFDDIRWSRGLWKAWQRIRRDSRLAWTVDLGRFGVCVVGAEPAPARHANLSRWTGWFRVHGAPALTAAEEIG